MKDHLFDYLAYTIVAAGILVPIVTCLIMEEWVLLGFMGLAAASVAFSWALIRLSTRRFR